MKISALFLFLCCLSFTLKSEVTPTVIDVHNRFYDINTLSNPNSSSFPANLFSNSKESYFNTYNEGVFKDTWKMNNDSYEITKLTGCSGKLLALDNDRLFLNHRIENERYLIIAEENNGKCTVISSTRIFINIPSLTRYNSDLYFIGYDNENILSSNAKLFFINDNNEIKSTGIQIPSEASTYHSPINIPGRDIFVFKSGIGFLHYDFKLGEFNYSNRESGYEIDSNSGSAATKHGIFHIAYSYPEFPLIDELFFKSFDSGLVNLIPDVGQGRDISIIGATDETIFVNVYSSLPNDNHAGVFEIDHNGAKTRLGSTDSLIIDAFYSHKTLFVMTNSQEVFMFKDGQQYEIYAGSEAGRAHLSKFLGNVGDSVMVNVAGDEIGNELWVVDPLKQNLELVADLNDANTSSEASFSISYLDTFYFWAKDNDKDYSFWKLENNEAIKVKSFGLSTLSPCPQMDVTPCARINYSKNNEQLILSITTPQKQEFWSMKIEGGSEVFRHIETDATIDMYEMLISGTNLFFNGQVDGNYSIIKLNINSGEINSIPLNSGVYPPFLIGNDVYFLCNPEAGGTGICSPNFVSQSVDLVISISETDKASWASVHATSDQFALIYYFDKYNFQKKLYRFMPSNKSFVDINMPGKERYYVGSEALFVNGYYYFRVESDIWRTDGFTELELVSTFDDLEFFQIAEFGNNILVTNHLSHKASEIYFVETSLKIKNKIADVSLRSQNQSKPIHIQDNVLVLGGTQRGSEEVWEITNSRPIINFLNLEFTILEDSGFHQFNLLPSVEDADGDDLVWARISENTSNMTMQFATDNDITIEYETSSNENGIRTFEFYSNDGFWGIEKFVAKINITPVNDLPTGSISISGIAKEGEVLNAEHNIEDVDGISSFQIEWRANGSTVATASKSDYTLKSSDVGKTITAAFVYTDDDGTPEQVVSEATLAVEGKPKTSGWALIPWGLILLVLFRRRLLIKSPL